VNPRSQPRTDSSWMGVRAAAWVCPRADSFQGARGTAASDWVDQVTGDEATYAALSLLQAGQRPVSSLTLNSHVTLL
jgi:hypothetical protein